MRRSNMFDYTGCFYNDPEWMQDDINSRRMDTFEYILKDWEDNCFCDWVVPHFTNTKYEGVTTFYTNIDREAQGYIHEI